MRSRLSIFSFVLLLSGLTLSSSGCYTAQELRQLAAETPDPRQKHVDKLWEAMKSVAQEETWPIELERREDLLIATSWMSAGESLRRRVRFLVIVAPNGVGINVTVKHEAFDARLPLDAQWVETADPVLKLQQRKEEQALAVRIQRKWQEAP